MTYIEAVAIACTALALIIPHLIRRVTSLEGDVEILRSRQKELLGYIQENAEVLVRLGEYVQKMEKL